MVWIMQLQGSYYILTLQYKIGFVQEIIKKKEKMGLNGLIFRWLTCSCIAFRGSKLFSLSLVFEWFVTLDLAFHSQGYTMGDDNGS